MVATLSLQTQPPRHSYAEDFNKQAAKADVTQTESQPVSQVVTPQPTAKVETVVSQPPPQPKPKPVAPTGCAHYVSLLNKYNWNVSTMTKVMQAESGCNPNAIGDTRVIGGIYAPSCGLFQVRTLKGRPNCAQLQDPATNIAWAYRIYQGQGMSAWSVCKTKVSCY